MNFVRRAIACVTACLIGGIFLFVSPDESALGQTPVFTERAYQDREILYELQAPETHAFRITHDYTVRNPGERYYFNVVRAGSHVTDPESIDLDSGESLKRETIDGKTARERKLAVGEAKDDTEIVVSRVRLRRERRIGFVSKRLTPMRRVCISTATSWFGIEPLGACGTRWCCLRAGI